MTPHSSTPAWKIPWVEEPGRLQFMGSLRVGRARATSLSLFTFMHWRRKWQPTPVFLPGESQDSGAWWAAISGVAQSRTRLRRLSSSSSSIMPVMMISSFLTKSPGVGLRMLPFCRLVTTKGGEVKAAATSSGFFQSPFPPPPHHAASRNVKRQNISPCLHCIFIFLV